MVNASVVKGVLGLAVYMTTLGLLRYKPWEQVRKAGTPAQAGVRRTLQVGFLPVT